jgi:hypothetical protein
VGEDSDALVLGSDAGLLSDALLPDEVTVGVPVGSAAGSVELDEAGSLGTGAASVGSASSATAAPVTPETPWLLLTVSGGATA